MSEYQRGASDVIKWLLNAAIIGMCLYIAFQAGVGVERARHAEVVGAAADKLALSDAIVIDQGNNRFEFAAK